ncbi:6898_t:CDS:2 [Entrophospora sp. SA101]|nr:6898_t:CDS:2 [Entrophospora sp. SA101]
MEVWFPQVMASLSRRPRLLGSMRDLFSTLQIMAHTSGNERKLEIERMKKSFTYYNIFNATCNTSHATLRMCFQIPLSFNTQEGPEDILQNISEKDLFGMNNVAENNMKSQISAAQTKHERIGVLFSEYLNDTTTPHGTRAIKTHKETMWDLVNHLLDTFNVADNKALECNLWKTTKPCALNPVGVQRLFDCYTNGHERMNSICRQEVFGTEKIEKKGRRALNITKTTMKNINENKKAEKKTPTQFSDNSLQIQPVQLLDRFLNQVIYKHKPNLIYMNQ